MICALSGAFSFVSANQEEPWWLAGGISAANCIAAYQPKGAASLAASYVNLANPETYDAALGVAPTWDSVNGWKFSALQYLRTGIVPTSGFSMVVRFSNDGTPSAILCGCRQSSPVSAAYSFQPRRGTTPYVVRYQAGGSGKDVAPGVTSGILAICGANAYRNGVLDGVITTGTLPSYGIDINGQNNAGTNDSKGIYYVQAFSLYNIDISSYISLLNTAMAAL